MPELNPAYSQLFNATRQMRTKCPRCGKRPLADRGEQYIRAYGLCVQCYRREK